MKKFYPKRHKSLDERLEQEVNKELREVKREWRHLLKFRDENYLLFTAFVILVSALVIVNTVYVINHSSLAGNSQSSSVLLPDNSKVLTSLETGSNSGETVKISNVTENDKPDYAFMISPDETMLILNISIKNETLLSQHLIPVNQFYVRSNEGDYVTMHPSMYVTTPLAANELKPGVTVTGQLSFNVPKHIANPLLYIDTGWDKNAPLVFDVLR